MATSKDLIDRLKGVLTFFNELEPIIDQLDSHPTSVAEAAPLTEDEVEQIGRLRDELAAAKADLSALNSQNAAVSSELESRAELVEAARTGTGSAGAKDLAMAYEDQANDHVGQWKIWGIALLGTLFIALIGGVLLLELNPPPDDPSTPELVSHLVLDLLVVGLLIYAIRVTSLQFSVHRHLAAVATNKADALKTFSRIVSSGSSAETRDRLAEVLAHHVFVSDSTGFLDVASDQITLPERLVDPIAKRVGGTG